MILRCSYLSKNKSKALLTEKYVSTIHRMGRHLAYAKAIEEATYGEGGEYRIMGKTGLSVLTLRAFISAFTEELTGYYDEDFGPCLCWDGRT